MALIERNRVLLCGSIVVLILLGMLLWAQSGGGEKQEHFYIQVTESFDGTASSKFG